MQAITEENVTFSRLYSALLPARDRIRGLRRSRSFLRYTALVALAWFTISLVALIGGQERFPDMAILGLPLGAAVLAGIIHAIIGRDLAQEAQMFRMIALDADPDYPVIERVKATLESDGTFDMLRAEGQSLERWRSSREQTSASESYSLWLMSAADNSFARA